MEIFIPVVGQFINIGDTLHRKILISWLKNENITLHVFVGNAPQSFIDALGLRDNDVIYVNQFHWAKSLFLSVINNKTSFIFNPGEINLRKSRLKLELFLFPILKLVKLKGGSVIRVGIASKSDTQISNFSLWNRIISNTSKIYWRTIKSQELFSIGQIIPDLAFYDVSENIDFNAKNKLVISMRGDRKSPNNQWIETVKSFADQNNLEINVISQVRIDNKMTVEIANKLNGKAIIWPDELSHNEQEEILNNLYLNTKIAISDRLHVLIAAFTKGVIPVNLASSFSNKVQDHFDVLKIEGVTIDFENESDSINKLNQKLKSGFPIQIMKNAKSTLEQVKQEILQTLNS